MALKFLSDIDVSGALELNGNLLKNARLQNASTNPSGPSAGQVYYNTSDNEIRFYNGTSWINLSSATGDITAVTAGTGLTGGGTSGAVTLNVIGGTGITANANDVALDTATASALGGVKIGSRITITSGVISADVQSTENFTSALLDKLNNIDAQATATSHPAITTNGSTPSLASGISAVEVRSLIGAGTGSSNLALGTTSSTALAGNTTTISTSQATAITANTAKVGITTAQANAITANSAKVTNTDVNVNAANLKSRLGELSGTTTIGADAASDTVIIRGNLRVQGETTTVESETMSVADNIIVLNSNVTGTPSEDSGIEIERGTATNVSLRWDESSDRWQFTNNGSTYYNIPISTEYNNTTYSVGDGGLTQKNFTSTLKTKLDGIEANATADQTAAQIRTALGTGNSGVIPSAGSAGQFLKHDGTFGTPSYTTNTNRSDASVYALFSGGSNITISGTGVIAGTANTQRSDEEIRDLVADVMVGNGSHTGISASDDDSGNGDDLVNAYNHYSATYTNATSISVGGDVMQIAFPANITLFDSIGKVVFAETQQNTSSGDLSITGLPSGTYYLSVMGSRP